MKLIAGLGNPGRGYSRHRHNVGFRVVDELAGRHSIELRKQLFSAQTGSGSLAGESVLLAKPQTFMNLSGDSVAPLLGYFRIGIENLIVIHDDLDLECGRIKLMSGAGHGGHNGVRSIIENLGSSEFVRVRVGIGRPPSGFDAANYVLSPFSEEEERAMEKTILRAADAIECIVSKGLAAAQQDYH